jgi:hypothetical protein
MVLLWYLETFIKSELFHKHLVSNCTRYSFWDVSNFRLSLQNLQGYLSVEFLLMHNGIAHVSFKPFITFTGIRRFQARVVAY